MAIVTITINSREYGISCEDGQEVRIIQLARILDEKAKMITTGVSQVNENMLLTMVGLILADEISELKKNAAEPKPIVDTVDKKGLLEVDSEIASKIKNISQEIKSIANNINLI